MPRNITSIKRNPDGSRKLAQSDFVLERVDHHFATFVAWLPIGWDFEETLRPDFWSNVAYQLTGDHLSGNRALIGSRIEVMRRDFSLYAVLLVRAIGEKSLTVECIGPNCDENGVACKPRHIGLEEVKADGFRARWNPGRKAHEVIRLADNEVVYAAQTKEAAQAWLDKLKAA